MDYILEIKLYTDGDFGFPYIPRDMNYSGYDYSLKKKYRNKEEAIHDTLDILNFLERNVQFGNWDGDLFYECLSEFREKLANSVEHDDINIFCARYGNQEIFINFYSKPKMVKVEIAVSAEEYEKIQNVRRKMQSEDMEKVMSEIKEKLIKTLEEWKLI